MGLGLCEWGWVSLDGVAHHQSKSGFVRLGGSQHPQHQGQGFGVHKAQSSTTQGSLFPPRDGPAQSELGANCLSLSLVQHFMHPMHNAAGCETQDSTVPLQTELHFWKDSSHLLLSQFQLVVTISPKPPCRSSSAEPPGALGSARASPSD